MKRASQIDVSLDFKPNTHTQTNYLINETDKLPEPRFWEFWLCGLGKFDRLECLGNFDTDELGIFDSPDLGILMTPHHRDKQRRAEFSPSGPQRYWKEGVMIEWRVEGMSDDWTNGGCYSMGEWWLSRWVMEGRSDEWVDDRREKWWMGEWWIEMFVTGWIMKWTVNTHWIKRGKGDNQKNNVGEEIEAGDWSLWVDESRLGWWMGRSERMDGWMDGAKVDR